MPLRDDILVLTIFAICLHTVCMFALLFAINVLRKMRRQIRLRNQRIILANLCIIEFFTAVFFVKLQIDEVTERVPTKAENTIQLLLRVVLAVNYPLSMHHLAVDRFLEVFLHLRYPICITERVTRMVVYSAWLFSAVFSAVYILLKEYAFSTKSSIAFMSHYVLAMDVSILVNAIFTYTYLYFAYKRFREFDRRNTVSGGKQMKGGKFYIPFLIILTYCLFEVSGAVLTMAAYMAQMKEMLLIRKIGLLLYGFGFLADVSVYILCRNMDRKETKSKRNVSLLSFDKRQGGESSAGQP